LPTVVLLQAAGWFAILGGTALVAAVGSVVATIVLVPAYGAPGFAFASAATVQALLVPGLLGLEWLYWRRRGVSATGALLQRALIVPVSIAAAVVCSRSPMWAAFGLALVTAAGAAHTLHGRRRSRAGGSGGRDAASPGPSP
jgi:hypothetical protein